MTYLDEQRARLQEYQAMACELTGLSSEEYARLQFEGAYQWLENVLGTDGWGLEQWPKCKEFWNWWRLQWYQIDVQLFGCPAKGLSGKLQYNINRQCWQAPHPADPAQKLRNIITQQGMRNCYLAYHRAHRRNILLNSALIEATFHQLQKTIVTNHKTSVKHA